MRVNSNMFWAAAVQNQELDGRLFLDPIFDKSVYYLTHDSNDFETVRIAVPDGRDGLERHNKMAT
jgi:hypothetical protein